MDDTPMIYCVIKDQVARLVISNPRRANALTMAMIEQLDSALARIERSAVHVVQILGAGERFFCAGADIGEWGPLSPERMGRHWIGEGNRVFQRLAHLGAVVIAQINGDDMGADWRWPCARIFVSWRIMRSSVFRRWVSAPFPVGWDVRACKLLSDAAARSR